MNPKIVALHKHYCTADAVKQFVRSDLPISDFSELADDFVGMSNEASQFHRMSVWYALIYVVIEGYLDLNIPNEKVDEILNNKECVDSLRLFRNATFHYQKDPLTEKALKFLEAENSEIWIRRLNIAFEGFFLDNLPIKETLEILKKETT